MKLNSLKLAAAVALIAGLYGCSEGDDTTITIDAPTTNTSTTTGGGTTSTLSENCPDWSGAKQKDADGNDVCALPSQISENRTLTNDVTWLMEGRVTVGNGNAEIADAASLANGNPILNVTLTIQEGTEIKGKTGTFANLLITRGSKIQAVGSAAAPIIFSSDDAGYTGSGEWGGLIIHGFGNHNECSAMPCNIDAEGESGFAGGFGMGDDDSGTLSYVVVTEGGYEFAVGDEINGISLVAVGSGTTMDHIQVNDNSDDGIEFFGGDVNVKYVVLTANQDDSIDWDEGYQGNIQYAIIKQGAVGDKSIEADTFGTNAFLSKPTIANATFLGYGTSSQMLDFKEGSGGFVHNSIALPQSAATQIEYCVRTRGAEAVANIGSGNLVLNNFIMGCPALSVDGNGVDNTGDWDITTVFTVDPAVDAAYAATVSEATLGAAINWTTVNGTWSNSVADGAYLDATDYVGAVEPGTAAGDAWWANWTLPGTL